MGIAKLRRTRIKEIGSDDIEIYKKDIGEKVIKLTKRPFKSTFQINTIRDVIVHPFLKLPAYTFEEDDSFVAIRECKIYYKDE